jgi:hypothetical protein
MRAGPAGFFLAAGRPICRPRPGGVLWRTMPKQNILFQRFSAAFTKTVSKVRNINHIQLNHRSPAVAVFHPSTRPRLMQADAGILNHVQAGRAAWRLLTQAGPLRNTDWVPGRSGIPGNEEANCQAKEAREGQRYSVRERKYTSAANRDRRFSEGRTAAQAKWEADKCTKLYSYRLKGKAGSKRPDPITT